MSFLSCGRCSSVQVLLVSKAGISTSMASCQGACLTTWENKVGSAWCEIAERNAMCLSKKWWYETWWESGWAVHAEGWEDEEVKDEVGGKVGIYGLEDWKVEWCHVVFVWGGSKDMGLVVFGGSEDVVVGSKGVVIIVGLGCVRRFGWVEWWCKPSIRCSMRMRDGGGVGTTWSRRLWMQKIKDKRRNYNNRMSCSHRCLKRKKHFQ